jgi:hypothetical protein
MLELLQHVHLMPFHLSLLLLFSLSMLETIGFYLKAPPSLWLKRCIPRQLRHADLLNVKFSKLLIVVFLLMNFSCAGYVLQFAIYAQQNEFAPFYYVFFPALILAIFFTAFMIHCLDQVLPPKYTHVEPDLLGRLATLSTQARPSFPAQARVRDQFGQLHIVDVEPEFGELEQGSQVILIRMKRGHYIAKKIARLQSLSL